MAGKHYVEVSDEVWKELVRIQKQFKVDKHALVDDIIAIAGDLEAVAENHVEIEREISQTPDDQPALIEEDDLLGGSTRAAVLEPTASELENLI